MAQVVSQGQEINHKKRENFDRFIILILIVLSVVFFLLFLFLGRYPQLSFLPVSQIVIDPLANTIFLNYRLPRTLLAFLLGMTLSACGLVLQMVFRNPLVEPGFLGVSQGGAFGAALAIILGGSILEAQLAATCFAILGLFLSVFMARRIRYGGWILRLVLAGIAASAFFSAGLGILKYLADPLKQLPEITFWLLGGLYGANWSQVYYALPAVLIPLIILFFYRWRLNLLTLEESTAFSLGLRVNSQRSMVLILAVIPVAVMVSISGIISWVGLIIPHLARKLVGANARFSFPCSLLMGGIFVSLCDTVARCLMAGEIPLGILTSLIGAVLFVIILSLPERTLAK